MVRSVGRDGLDVGDEADKRGIAFEDHIELAHLVALHAVRTLWIDLVPIHVTIDAFDHRARTFQIAEPVLCMCRAQGRGVFLDERLKDAVDVRANRLAICRAIVLNVRSRSDRGKEQSAKSKGEKRETENPQSHLRNLR